jgi:hypothetical protein
MAEKHRSEGSQTAVLFQRYEGTPWAWEDFRQFCSNLRINNRDSIGQRYQLITKRLNLIFLNLDCEASNRFYGGSCGRGKAIRGFSVHDVVFTLPYHYYQRYTSFTHNGQSWIVDESGVLLRVDSCHNPDLSVE